MCGLVVTVSPDRSLPLDALRAMNAALRHRGPDDEGYLLADGDEVALLGGADTPGAVLEADTPSRPRPAAAGDGQRRGVLGMAHRRLSIVDLSPQGHQPMRRGDLYAVFNGEIYDHVERRAELEALGHRFASASDTEVLLAAFAHWGTEAFARLNGMWAVAIFDARRRTLTIARDRFGVKPLYWWQGPSGEWAMASEIKALLAHPRVTARADVAACVRWLQHGPESWRSATVFAGIRSFPAGHWAVLPLDGGAALPVEPRPFWSWPEVDPDRLAAPFVAAQADALAAEYAALLQDAVRVRMRMDVRFGTALSGGLDSSQIALLVNRELRARGVPGRQEVFSSVYARTRSPADESGFIASVARHLDVHSNCIEPRCEDVPVEHEHLIWALDLPPVNTLMSSWHTYALVAQRGVVVTLDGQGADEQLAGYVHYPRSEMIHSGSAAALRQALALHRSMQGVGGMIAQGLAGHALRRLLGTRGLASLADGFGRGRNLALPLGQALRDDFRTHLQTLLFYADRSSMAWSLESRMPFMDWRLVEFAARLPLALRIHDGWTKWIARHAMRDQLPPEIVWRRDKLGWSVPESDWFGSGAPLQDWLQARLVSSAFVRDVLGVAGRRGLPTGLPERLRLLNLAVWHRIFFEESGRPGRTLGPGRVLGTH